MASATALAIIFRILAHVVSALVVTVVAGTRGDDIVKDGADELVLELVAGIKRRLDRIAFRLFPLDHQDHGVNRVDQDTAVRYGKQWRGIDDDEVEGFAS